VGLRARGVRRLIRAWASSLRDRVIKSTTARRTDRGLMAGRMDRCSADQIQHIQVKVQGVGRPVTTQLYFSDDANRVKDRH
jgi:protocatechuate 3,4-dioxygenase beta subunit